MHLNICEQHIHIEREGRRVEALWVMVHSWALALTMVSFAYAVGRSGHCFSHLCIQLGATSADQALFPIRLQ